MRSNECRCSGASGGSTKCPENHLAICVRGRDRECYGQCIPIPNQYDHKSESFYQWLSLKLKATTLSHFTEWKNFTGDFLDEINKNEIIGNYRGNGEVVYQHPNFGIIKVSYSYTFLESRSNR